MKKTKKKNNWKQLKAQSASVDCGWSWIDTCIKSRGGFIWCLYFVFRKMSLVEGLSGLSIITLAHLKWTPIIHGELIHDIVQGWRND